MSFNQEVKNEIESALVRRTRPVRDALLAEQFLLYGTISDPQKEYRIEFNTIRHTPTKQLCKILTKRGFSPYSARRSGRQVLYITASEQIEDILSLMGAQNAALVIMNAKISKDIVNKVNRIQNCSSANTDKTAKKNEKMLLAIEKLEKSNRFLSLPGILQETAKAVQNSPKKSLFELSFQLNISKSGLYHRLQKILLAAEIK